MVAKKIKQLLPNDWPLTIGDLPATNTVAVGVMEYDGATSTEYFGMQHGSSVQEPIVKIVVRHTSYQIGEAWVEQAKQLLHRYHDDTFLSVLLVGSPQYLGRNPQKLHEFQVTFRTQVKE